MKLEIEVWTATNSIETARPRALNAYGHGLTGQVLILTPEDEAAYKAHCHGIHECYAPVGGMEIELVEEIADDRWRLKHASALINNSFALLSLYTQRIKNKELKTQLSSASCSTNAAKPSSKP